MMTRMHSPNRNRGTGTKDIESNPCSELYRFGHTRHEVAA